LAVGDVGAGAGGPGIATRLDVKRLMIGASVVAVIVGSAYGPWVVCRYSQRAKARQASASNERGEQGQGRGLT